MKTNNDVMALSVSISTRLRHQHESLPDLIAGLTETQLKVRPNPEKWSPFEQIAHLTAYQPVFIGRLARIRQEESPSFGRYVAGDDPRFHATLALPVTELLRSIVQNGKGIADEATAWDPPLLQRKALHAKYGLLSAPQWMEFYLLHEAHHLFAIFMLVQELQAQGLQ